MHTTAMQSILIASLPASVVVLAPAGDETSKWPVGGFSVVPAPAADGTRGNPPSGPTASSSGGGGRGVVPAGAANSDSDNEQQETRTNARLLRMRYVDGNGKRKRQPRPKVAVLSGCVGVSASTSPQSGKSTATPTPRRHKSGPSATAAVVGVDVDMSSAVSPPAFATGENMIAATGGQSNFVDAAAAAAVGAHAAFDSDVQTGAAAYDQVPAVRLSCLNIMEYRLGKYQGMHWSVDASVLPYSRLYSQARGCRIDQSVGIGSHSNTY